ncbi:MAG: precorrin-3B C(17)-methyltransferase, partial [Gemmataceae bacterium]|nr:precorrin-3B C(17)-methyltransferase [Gemmataceae bacterium]
MGHFWAIGVGPGDPELLTLKAVRLIQEADVLYHPGPRPDQGRAWEIVRHLVRPEQEVRVVLSESMAAVSATAEHAAYRPAVERIAADCRQGRRVVLLTEGDPTLYSTAAPVWQFLARLAPEVPSDIVPGVTSITAAAARVRWSLAQKDETLAVIPAGYHVEYLQEPLHDFSTVCFLKPGSALEELPTLLSGHEAYYVEEATTPAEWVTADLSAAAQRRNYFSLVLARRKTDPAPPRGRLWVVGLGPGDLGLLTRTAERVLRAVDAVVGYAAYLDRLASLRLRAERHPFPIGAEIERADFALGLAAGGRNVALVSSGDAGVYGMASLVMERAAAWPGVELVVVPGVTAATAAGALLGAPLGHDFACVSLSDLLTPWELIERRLHAAGQGDFVLAIYNPVSSQRRWQLPKAREVLLRYRRPDTPVGVVTCAFRLGCRVEVTTLEELNTDGVTMESTLLVGNSQTRVVGGRLVTPRGYAAAAPGVGGGRRPAP